ncbi:hypothetical protein [Nostocoides sp.]
MHGRPVVATSSRAGDRFVLCSDGLLGDDLRRRRSSDAARPRSDADAACEALIALAPTQHGGEDNITALVVKVEDEAHPAHDQSDVTEVRPMPAFTDEDTEIGPIATTTETGDPPEPT